ncbi:hypothetical protein SAY87_010145 [Trapa incisa]|uniref:Uncharacterized protein n=1 Tax=Trapa incisa TaxID=236973 RepID=A0AAN7GGP3_9MYRT|nr:hypothetical protein SAY87_010145 [Trapa incisa]
MKSILADHCSDGAHSGGNVGIGAGAAAEEAGNCRNILGTLHRVSEAAAAALVVEGMDIPAATGIPRRAEVEGLKGNP